MLTHPSPRARRDALECGSIFPRAQAGTIPLVQGCRAVGPSASWGDPEHIAEKRWILQSFMSAKPLGNTSLHLSIPKQHCFYLEALSR